ncbi:MAG TPA: LysM peptidoglycan-binding domain-containing protein, partial [Chondromyces sp.]|nr:LysM peptidoglycan-binding domain-containing protein [Chondromyces sp.]
MAIHTVSPGDTLWKISRVYGTSVSTLLRVNGLETGALVPGLNLYIPHQGLPERFYRVKAGDTIWKIARQYQTTIETIIAANPTISLNNLRIGQRLRIPTNLRYRMETLMFMDVSDPLPYLNILRANAKYITYLAIFTYSFTESGELIQAEDEAILRESKQYNILPLMVVSNYEGGAFSPSLADQVLRTTSIRRKFISNIVAAVENKQYAGVNIDFEFVSPARRNDFTTFLRELKAALGRRILQVNVHAKTNDDPSNSLTGSQDYKAIGQIVDHMAVM